MKVLYVSKALTVGAYREKLTALARHVEMRAVMPERWDDRGTERLEDGGPPLARWPVLFPGSNHLHLYRRPERMLAGSGSPPDLVHVDEEPYSAVTFQLVRQAHRRGIPSLFFAWQNLEKRLPPPFRALRTHVFRRAAGAVAGTRRAAAVLRAGGYEGPLAVIPQFGVDPGRFTPDPRSRSEIRRTLGIEEGAFVMGYGGRLVPEKGVGLLLEAAAALPGAHLLVVGDGPKRGSLERAARTGGIRSRVHFAGHRPSQEVPRWLAACDVVVLPSVGRKGWAEQFGRILVEAMACGVPVVGARSGEIPEVVGDAALLVSPGDPAGLTQALAALARSEVKREELGGRGRKRVLELYTHEVIATRTAAFYRELVP